MASSDLDPISQRIVRVAAQRFISEGYSGTSMLSVAKEARTSKREIYDRFGSKEKLFEHVMDHLCQLGENEQNAPPAETLTDFMAGTARAVLKRFLLPETRGVLIAAFGADSSFPEIPKLFWESGPGRAVSVLADHFVEHPDVAIKDAKTARLEAHRFIMNCVAPFVLSFLFEPDYRVSKDETDDAIASTIRQTLERIGS